MATADRIAADFRPVPVMVPPAQQRDEQLGGDAERRDGALPAGTGCSVSRRQARSPGK